MFIEMHLYLHNNVQLVLFMDKGRYNWLLHAILAVLHWGGLQGLDR